MGEPSIAIIGALTGLGSLGWPVFWYFHSRKAKVEVEVGKAVMLPA